MPSRKFSEDSPDSTFDVIVVGAGAAGLFAAGTSASRERSTLVLEKNAKLGVKILMSGGTRCNITHNLDWQGIADAFETQQARFLKFSLASLTPEMVVDFFRVRGVETKVESTGKIFPKSDRALDVRNALVDCALDSGARILARKPVTSIERADGVFVVRCDQDTCTSRSLIVTVGGQSYPGCGTTGDGYSILANFGHTIIAPRPALVPIRLATPWVHRLKGITIPDVGVCVAGLNSEKICGRSRADRGSFLFTHFGVSGPVAMNVSRAITDPANSFPKSLVCDWFPEESRQALSMRLANDRIMSGERAIGNWLGENLPKRMAESLCDNCQLDFGTRLAELSRKQNHRLLEQLKNCQLPIDGTLGFKKAEVTAGGVALDEVNSKTMESKLIPRLYLAGEILDIDGPIGGYNFQAAFSTGNLAGLNA